ncbi:MAG: fibronectin type III domain-containing protein [Lepagella sp.]
MRSIYYSLFRVVLAVLMAVGVNTLASAETYLSEDFSGFTAGTQELADGTNIGAETASGSSENLDNYTQTLGWTCAGIYQAGGTAVVKGVLDYGVDYLELDSPYLTLKDNVKVTVRARLYEGEGEQEDVQMRMIFSKTTWGYSEPLYVTVTSEWQEFTYTTTLTETEWNLRLSICNDDYTSSPVQFDYITIESDDAPVVAPDAPTAKAATNVTSESFTANWSRVSGVLDYKLYVTYQEDGETRFFINGDIVNVPTPYHSTSKKVTGLDPETIYSYYVTAYSNELESENSNIIDVVSIDMPQNIKFSEVSNDSFKVTWDRSPKAQEYDINLYSITHEGVNFIKTVSTSDEFYTFSDLADYSYLTLDITSKLNYKDELHKSDPSCHYGVAMGGVAPEGDLVYDEDFSRFTNGSLDEIYYKEYDSQDPNNTGAYVNGWDNIIPDEYTAQPGWMGSGVAEAGGVAAVCYKPYPTTYNGGWIQTPAIDSKSIVTLKFRVKEIPQFKQASPENPIRIDLIASTPNYEDANFEFFHNVSTGLISETLFYEDSYTDDVIRYDDYYILVEDDQWHEVSISFFNDSSVAYKLRLSGTMYSMPFFIDDIKVYVSPIYIDAPVAWEADNFVKDGFTAYWGEVAKADSYLVSVFTRKAGKEEYAITDMEVEGTETEIRGLDPWTDWSFNVKAKKGNLVSEASNSILAFGISTPEPAEASAISLDQFTANWERTPKATRYDLYLYKVDDTNYTLVSTVEIEDGATTSYTFEDLAGEEGDVMAYALKAYYDTSSSTAESKVSDMMEVVLTQESGMQQISQKDVVVKSVNGKIYLSAPQGFKVDLYTMSGMHVYSSTTTDNMMVITPMQKGVYLITIGNLKYKVNI